MYQSTKILRMAFTSIHPTRFKFSIILILSKIAIISIILVISRIFIFSMISMGLLNLPAMLVDRRRRRR
jgi:hypothetical protein